MPSRAARAGSVAEPVQRMRRVWGTSPRSAPSVTTSSQPVARATEITSSQNVGQRRFGSTPRSSTRSRPLAGVEPAENASAGHWISRITPSTSSTVGRAAWKSRYSSLSSVANTRADVARQPAHAVARRVGRIVPARERGDESGSAQVRLRVPADGHALHHRRGRSHRPYAPDDGIAQRADAADRDLDDVTVVEEAWRRAGRADAGRCAGEDDVAGSSVCPG